MRTNILIDDTVLEEAMRAGPFKTKKDAVDAGLRLLARQAAYRDILRYEGKLKWDEEPTPAPRRRDAASAGKPRRAVRAPSAKR